MRFYVNSYLVLAVSAIVSLNQSSEAFQQIPTSTVRKHRLVAAKTTELTVSVLEEWQVTDDGKVVGKIKNNPNYNDGDVVTTSPLVNPTGATEASFVTSLTGSEYLLGSPRSNSGPSNNLSSREDFVGDVLKVSGLVGLTAFGFNLGSSGGGDSATMMATSPSMDVTNMNIEIPKSSWTKALPGLVEPTGGTLSPQEVRDLFGIWNNALMTGNPDTVAMRYTKEAVLLPTKSDVPRSDYDGIRDYFVHFLEKKPVGKILESYGELIHACSTTNRNTNSNLSSCSLPFITHNCLFLSSN